MAVLVHDLEVGAVAEIRDAEQRSELVEGVHRLEDADRPRTPRRPDRHVVLERDGRRRGVVLGLALERALRERLLPPVFVRLHEVRGAIGRQHVVAVAVGEEQLGDVGALHIVAQVALQRGIPAQLAGAVELPFQGGNVELREPALRGVLGGLIGGDDEQRARGQQLRLAAALADVGAGEVTNSGRDFDPALAGLLFEGVPGGLPRDQREADDQGERDAEADEQNALAELLGARGHRRLVA